MSANGARFHVAECGQGPLVLLLHGFPQFWWAWRHQLPALAAAGYRTVAMDLRGYGASDKPPKGYDAPTLVADVAGVIRCLGESTAVLVGAGIGGALSWAMPALHPELVRAVAVLGVAHPLVRAGSPLADLRQAFICRPVVDLQRRHMSEHRFGRDPRCVRRLLRQWSGDPDSWPTDIESAVYADAMALPFAAHAALEGHRWLLRSPLRIDGRRFLNRLRPAVRVPVLQLHGSADPAVPASVAARSEGHVGGPYCWRQVPAAGHFPHEESPEAVTTALLEWLAALPD